VVVIALSVGLAAGSAASVTADAASAAGGPGSVSGFDPARSLVVGRLAQETDYANPDGTYTAVLATHSVNFRSADGLWHPIDNRVQADAARPGGFVNRANSWRVHFGSAAEGVQVDTGAGSVAVSPDGTGSGGIAAGAVTPSATPSGDGVVYRDVWPGADLRYTVTGDAVKESVLIKDRAAGSSFAFALRSGAAADVRRRRGGDRTGLTVRPDGSAVPAGALGSAVRFAAPQVVRADGEQVAAAGARLAASAGRVVLSVDPAWLAAQPDSAFPVDLDPSIFVHPDTDRAYRSDGESCSGTACMIQVGNSRDGGDTYWRTVAHFPYESLFGDHVLGASIGTGWQAGTLNAYTVHVYWASAYSYAGAVRGSVLASGTPGTSGQALTGSGLTSQVSSWIDSRTSGSAFGFVGTATAGLYTYQKFDMALFVDYDRPPSTPTSRSFYSPSHTCVTGSSRPVIDGTFPFVLKATLADPDGNNVRGYFELWNLAHTSRLKAVTSAVVASGHAVTVSFPANTLANGTSFAWRVRAWDGYLYGAWAGWCEATIHDPTPNVPTGVKFSSPLSSCVTGTTRPSMRGDQSISLTATISDPDRRNVYANFQVVKTGDAGTVYWTAKSATVASGSTVTVTMPAGKVADGTTFSWHADAQNGTFTSLVSAWSGWCEATVDNTSPASPQVSSPDFGLAGGTAAGTVGVPGSVTVTSSADTVKYVWSLTDLPATPPGCGLSAGGATTICVPTGAPATFTLEPEEAEPTVNVRAYDAAGNYANGAATFFVNEVTPGHGWITDNADGTETSLTDLSTAVPSLPLNLNAASGAFAGDGPNGAALHIDGTEGTTAHTLFGQPSDAPIDITRSFSVVAFVRQEVAASGMWQVALAQYGNGWSSVCLGVEATNHWIFSLTGSGVDASHYLADHAISASSPTLDQWTVLVGVWDAAAQQMRLYVDGQLAASTPHQANDSVPGPVTVGLSQGYGGFHSNYWNGDVADPVVYPGVLDQDQIDFITHVGYGG
jgi:hypothetical protein